MPGPVEVEVQVGDQEASSPEEDVGQRALMPTLIQWMTTEVLYCEIYKRIITLVAQQQSVKPHTEFTCRNIQHTAVNSYPKAEVFFRMEGG